MLHMQSINFVAVRVGRLNSPSTSRYVTSFEVDDDICIYGDIVTGLNRTQKFRVITKDGGVYRVVDKPKLDLLDTEDVDAVFDDPVARVIALEGLEGEVSEDGERLTLYVAPHDFGGVKKRESKSESKVIYEGEADKNWGSW